jgi:hypothetical protein
MIRLLRIRRTLTLVLTEKRPAGNRRVHVWVAMKTLFQMDFSQFFHDFMGLIKKEHQTPYAKRRCTSEIAFLVCIYVGLHQLPRLPLFLLAGGLHFQAKQG